MKELGIYVHIPFCAKKCLYCDFVSYDNKIDLVEEYVESVCIEILNCNIPCKVNLEEYTVNTIYIGGGTPSYIDSIYIAQILQTLQNKFKIQKDAEITIEINPGTITKTKLQEYKRSGVNRVSIGLQSTNNNILKQIGRIHTYEQFLESYDTVRKVGFKNVNVDLMLALPNQTIEILNETVEKVIRLNPEHISIYSLILEEETPLYNLVNTHKLDVPCDEIERAMYWNTKNMLEKAGYVHYEISNYAKPGYNSKHNTNCWEQNNYIGFGAAAHSYISNIRYSNTIDIKKYIQDASQKQIHETQTKQDKMKEYMLLGLRKIDGIQISDFKNKFIQNPLYIFRNELNRLVQNDLLQIYENSIKLTNKGINFANKVWIEFA